MRVDVLKIQSDIASIYNIARDIYSIPGEVMKAMLADIGEFQAVLPNKNNKFARMVPSDYVRCGAATVYDLTEALSFLAERRARRRVLYPNIVTYPHMVNNWLE